MRVIEWHAAFEIGHPSIDDGHRAIVDGLNAAIKALEGKSGDILTAAVTEAVETARQHFQQKEALLADAGFTDVDRHIACHQRLITEAEKILDICRSERFPRRVEPRLAELVHFLMAEIRDNDKELRAYLTGQKADEPDTDPPEQNDR